MACMGTEPMTMFSNVPCMHRGSQPVHLCSANISISIALLCMGLYAAHILPRSLQIEALIIGTKNTKVPMFVLMWCVIPPPSPPSPNP